MVIRGKGDHVELDDVELIKLFSYKIKDQIPLNVDCLLLMSN